MKYKIFDISFKNSTGIYGLHRSCDPIFQQMVHNNYKAIKNNLKTEHLLILRHVHGNTVIDADEITDFSCEPEADGAVTTRKDVALSIQSADCVPVLLASTNIVGAAHCGWQSAKKDVLANVVNIMRWKGADKITALIGPAIHQSSYEVDQKFYDEIITSEPDASKLFIPSINMQKWMFDLPGFVRLKLQKLDITNIIDLCEDTYSHPEKYYSYRRDIHHGITGNQTNILSTIFN